MTYTGGEQTNGNTKKLRNIICLLEGSVMVWAAVSWYSISPIITLHGRITAGKYMDRFSNQVHPMIQTLFPNNDAVFQDDSAPFHTVGTVQSWFEQYEGEL
jgi:hypothetical protein